MYDALENSHPELKSTQHALVRTGMHCAHQTSQYPLTIKYTEKIRNQIKQTHQQWMPVLNAVKSPDLIHDRDSSA